MSGKAAKTEDPNKKAKPARIDSKMNTDPVVSTDVRVNAVFGDDGKFKNLSEDFLKKQKDMFGASYATVAEALKLDSEAKEKNAFITIAPMIVRSMTSKDGGISKKFYDALASFSFIKPYNINGGANKTMIRLLAAAIVYYSKDNIFREDSKDEAGLKKAKEVVTVFNQNGRSGSELAKEINREVVAKMGQASREELTKIENAVNDFIDNSVFKPL